MQTAEELARQSSGVTQEMMTAAMDVLESFRVKKMSRRVEDRDIIYEVLSAALKTVEVPVLEVEAELSQISPVKPLTEGKVLSEEEWADFFENCSVIVRNGEIGQQIFQDWLQTAEGFRSLVETIARNGELVVPIGDYPGLVLFRRVIPVEESKHASVTKVKKTSISKSAMPPDSTFLKDVLDKKDDE